MDYAELIDDAGRFVSQYIDEHKKQNLLYHSIDHTASVVASATQIANHYQLNETDFFTVIIAAWFHDIGYFNGPGANHEERGAEIASQFLRNTDIAPGIEAAVRKCILATKMPQKALTLLEQIVCDADLFHFGTDTFSRNNKLLHKEVETTTGKHIPKDEWRRQSLELLEHHEYFTDYCRLLLNDRKLENIGKLRKKLDPAHPPLPAAETADTQQNEPAARDKPGSGGRGIETMFRITSGNNQRLSDMADNKAQILITVNSIILSAIISLLLRKLEDTPFLTYPTFALLTASVLTIVIAIIATRPSIPKGIFTRQDLDEKKVNLLFFGNFYRMNLEEYATGMRMMMKDNDFLYGTLIKDVYSQGVVLGRKYRLLRVSYNIFMFGLIISVLWFAAVFLVVKKM
jgi:Family of unknown function (DUF5706)/HD domain